MADKNKLLSIGDMAKLTQAGIQSLRYYEQINLLVPAYVDPHTGYRYYSFDQKCLIEVIQICVELDIPLKKLAEFIDEDETVNFYDILEHGKEIAQAKLVSIQKGLKFIDELRHNINSASEFQKGKMFYSREMEQKYFCVIPCKKPISDIKPFEIVRAVLKLHYDIDAYAELFHYGLVDIGVLGVYSLGGIEYYMFTELPEHIALNTTAAIMTAPSGSYLCTQSEERQIEQAPQIFSRHLKEKDNFLAIETDIFTHKYKINKLVNELRVIVTDSDR